MTATGMLDENFNVGQIFSRPPVSEDSVTYRIFFSQETVQQFSELSRLAIEISAELLPLYKDYIWQKDPFQLRAQQDDQNGLYLAGHTVFGDCIDDEWFIVFLLRRITQLYPDAVVQVFDNDGDFLLIEAAPFLPGWLEPSTSENRVFIAQGELHIIPLSLMGKSKKLSTRAAAEIVRNAGKQTIANPVITKAAFRRTEEYPDYAQQHLHHALCRLPLRVAQLLKHEPRLVSAAVEAFYTRDPSGMRACYRMDRFPPSRSVTVRVRFTRTLYAQLTCQKFHPPKPFHLPPRSAPAFRAAELGMKLACGFEILCHHGHVSVDQNADTTSTQNENQTDELQTYNFDRDVNWKIYHEKLKSTGYYKDEFVGSQVYQTLEKQAKLYYLQNILPKQDISNTDWAIQRIKELVKLPLATEEELTCFGNEEDVEEDDDSWLDVKQEDLDQMLQKEQDALGLQDEDFDDSDDEDEHDKYRDDQEIDEKDADKLSRIVESFRSFVDQSESGILGAEFPSERAYAEEDDDDMLDPYADVDEDMNEKGGVSKMADVQLNAERFFAIANAMLGTEPDNVNPSNHNVKKPSTMIQVLDEQETSEGEETDEEVLEAMAAMDVELSKTKLQQSFIRAADIIESSKTTNSAQDQVDTSEDEQNRSNDVELTPVDLDLNLVHNLLESYKSQQGMSGPASNILGRLGISLPHDIPDQTSSDDEH